MEAMSLNEEGFVTNFLVSGPKESLVQDNNTDKNQLRYESYLRSIIADRKAEFTDTTIQIGKMSELGMPWEYYYSHGNWFVDKSYFYPLLRKIEILAATSLISEYKQKVKAVIWTYGAVEIWVNGEKQGESLQPVYKPIAKQVIELSLEKGVNEVRIRFQNLGVRDTRNIFGLQIMEHQNIIQVKLPDESNSDKFQKLQETLDSCHLTKDKLQLSNQHQGKLTLRYIHITNDFYELANQYENVDITGKNEIEIQQDEKYISIVGEIDEFSLERRLEIAQNIHPQFISYQEGEISTEYLYKEISKVGAMPRGGEDRFSMYNVLARRAVGTIGDGEEAEIQNDLTHIENRRDCSDFVLCAYLRFLKLYPISNELEKRTKEVLLNYRYWMDQDGLDGMCFWSENHSLLFYSCALMAGQRYPNDTFVRAGKTGEELAKEAYDKVNEWLDDVLEYGFEEFQSGVYTPITFTGLLNLVDFQKGELGDKAVKVLDKILEMLALHTFKGSVISPQGRVYREVLYPCIQSVQGLIHLLDKNAPYFFNEWVSMLATSSYELPFHNKNLMTEQIDCEYTTGNALVKLYKMKDYIVTSVQSKREDKNPNYWKNICQKETADMSTHEYCKSLNECFHGTSRFEPGVYGYQQHMCSIGVDNDTVIFVNHPGGTCDATSLRPGYWFGNGIMPAIKQIGPMFGMIYEVDEEHPVSFTHVYFPLNKFEQIINVDGWKCGKKGKSYAAVWSSGEMTAYNDQLFDCEFRVMERQVGYVCIAGSEEEYGSFEDFIRHCIELNPKFDKEEKKLWCDNNFVITYVKCFNQTQFV